MTRAIEYAVFTAAAIMIGYTILTPIADAANSKLNQVATAVHEAAN